MFFSFEEDKAMEIYGRTGFQRKGHGINNISPFEKFWTEQWVF